MYNFIKYILVLLFPVMADHALPPARLVIRAPCSHHSHATTDDGHLSVSCQRIATSTHRDTWHTGMDLYRNVSLLSKLGVVFTQQSCLSKPNNIVF